MPVPAGSFGRAGSAPTFRIFCLCGLRHRMADRWHDLHGRSPRASKRWLCARSRCSRTLLAERKPPQRPKERHVPRGDGRLSNELDPGRPGPQDACGVFGVWAPGEDVAKLTYYGLYALQHRGQEAAGIAVSDGTGVVVYKDLGLVAQVFDEATLSSLHGHLAIGHTRYSTTGGSTWENAQPTLRATPTGGDRGATTIALAHNGNLVNTAELARESAQLSGGDRATSDSAIVTSLLAARPDMSTE